MQLGYYGKVIHRGDFVRFNLPKSFIDVWDDWLQRTLIDGEQRLGGDWAARYDAANVWRFALSPDIAGASAWVGLMSASADRVGRRFPFCIAAALPGSIGAIDAHTALTDWLAALEELSAALCTSGDRFDDARAALSALAEAGDEQLAVLDTGRLRYAPGVPGECEPISLSIGDATVLEHRSGLAQALDAIVRQSVGQYSVWRTATGSRAARTLLTGGLPLGANAAALFGGDWRAGTCASLTRTGAAAAAAGAQTSPDKPPVSAAPQQHEKLVVPDALEAEKDTSAEPYDSPPGTTPIVEPLELDEDGSTSLPWETDR